jgi:hypothetical protein
MKTYQATSQPNVFLDCESGEYFEHDGKDPRSQVFGLLKQAGHAKVAPYVATPVSEKRAALYRQGISLDEVIEAVFEKLSEGRSEKFDALQARRMEIRARFPSEKTAKP